MRHLKLFEEFKGKITDEADIVYKDSNLLIIVPKTPEATKKYSRNTDWCSNSKSGFYCHYPTSNLFRFHFKDGYKLRLTWDYLKWKGDYSGGTHWGQGGKLDGKSVSYYHIRPRDENNPFEFDYDKDDHRKMMVDRIASIPEEARKKVIEYQDNHSQDKTDILNSMYEEIQKIKIIDISKTNETDTYKNLKVRAKNDKEEFILNLSVYADGSFYIYTGSIPTEKGSSYFRDSGLEQYMRDKIFEWLKANKKELYTELKNVIISDEEV